MPEDAVHATAHLADRRSVEVRVEHVIGSLEHPLSDAQLEAKFEGLVSPVLGTARATEIAAACRALGSLTDIHALTARCRP